ncbi:MarR family winged helix-turn-helix transcriptional regulator [Enterococcus faecalis]|nr:MarR family transcriptional regulator [Enterococcus faecalis]
MKKSKSKALRFIGTISRAVNSKSDKKYKQLNLQKGQYMFLTRICEHPEINLSDLSKLLKVDKATTTKAVNKLIKVGYVKKNRNKYDKREFNLLPTESGVLIYKIIISEELNQLDILFENFNEEEVEVATKLIEKMSKNIENYWLDSEYDLPDLKI